MLGNTMLNDRIDVALQFASGIKGIEASLNETMIQVGTLFASIPAARAKLGKSVPLEAGVQATESLAAAATGLAASYRSVVDAHRHFATDREMLGLRAINWGDVQSCPPKGDSDEALTPHLHVVNAA